jgi:transposase
MHRFPDWVLKRKEKGTMVAVRNGKYYLYSVTSVWDREKGRPRKLTGEYLGKITPDGLVKPRHVRMAEEITVKEYGATEYVLSICSDMVVERLKEHYPGEWEDILVFAMARLFHTSPMKNVYHHYITSHLSDAFPEASVSPKPLSDLLYSIGLGRQQAVDFMKEFVEGSEFLAFDSTHVFSLSEDVIAATLGHNSEEEYVPQINLSLIFSLDRMHPSFFRIVPGSIRDVSVIPASVKEAGISNAIVVTDKGFYSDANVRTLEGEGLRYVMPLRRNSSLISYRRLSSGDMKKLDGFFQFDERVVWYYSAVRRRRGKKKKKIVVVYFDPSLKTEEERDFLSHVSEGKAKMEEYYERQRILGTISVLTDVEEAEPEEIFQLLKSRIDVEQLFDTLKNTLHADRTYMRDDHHLQGWMFVNFVAMLIYYRLYTELRSRKLLRKHSPHDVIVHLSRIQKLFVGGRWVLSEVPKTSREISEQLGFKPMVQN